MPVRSRLTIVPDVIGEVVDGEAVLLDLKSGVYFGLNAVGTRIWELIREHGDEQRVRDQLLQEFDVRAEELDRDLARWLSELERRGLCRREDGSSE